MYHCYNCHMPVKPTLHKKCPYCKKTIWDKRNIPIAKNNGFKESGKLW